ncbi:MAG: putative DNA binding domain-containing protein [Prevotella sp.]|nr:putative DNA binding domain-containing protein [Prevotella sp.]
MKNYILSLIEQGEHQQQDFKYKITDAQKLAKSVSAFANTDGGRLLIGVRDDGQVAGVRSEEEIYMMHAAAYTYCRPQPSIRFDTHIVNGRTVVVATVPPSDKRPIFALNKEDGERSAYIRINDENILASPVHLRLWREQQSALPVVTTYEDTHALVLETLQNNQPLTLNQLTRRTRLPRQQVVNLLARFIRYDLATWQYDAPQFLFTAR